MARIELRDCTIRLKDGLSGNAILAVNGAGNDTTANIVGTNSPLLNTDNNAVVPIGARFTVDNANGTLNHTTTHIVTARENAVNGVQPNTSNFTFSPRWNGVLGTDAVPLVNAIITFLPQAISIKIGEGNLTYTEHKEYKYMLDRGNLDVVRDADEKPVDVKTDFVYDFVTTGTSEDITPVDALKRQGGAAEWVNASVDPCEPYAVDMEIVQNPPCSGEQDEVTLLPSFRYETLEFNLKDASIAVSGKCNVEQATVLRVTHGDGNEDYPVV
jgi:hypothetical protein